MRNKHFNELDSQIIAHLATDGRISARQLSRIMCVSESTTRMRLQRLLSSSISVIALVNPSKIGFPIHSILGFKIEPMKISSSLDQLVIHERLSYVNPVTGTYDAMARALFRSPQDITKVMEEIIKNIDGLRDIQTIICLDTELGYFSPIPPALLQNQDISGTKLDKKDMQIIAYLSSNGRISYRQLAKLLSISEMTTRKRLKRLQDDRVITVRAMVEPATMGFPIMATIGFKLDLRRMKDIAKRLAGHKQINYVAACVGAFDLICIGLFRSPDDLNMVLSEFIHKLEGIKETQTFMSLDTNKRSVALFLPHTAPEF
ncbi:Lrp/AsnC family transcriptional regulator [Chloroflexota bacterium]